MLKRFLLASNFKRPFFTHAFASTLLIVTMTSCACTDSRKPEASNKNDRDYTEIAAVGALDSKKTAVEVAVVEVKSFKGNQVKGKVTFTKVPEGIKIVADIDGLSPGKHGFHVHEFGDCSSPETVGSHFDPTHNQHGGPDSPQRHVGDLGNLIADDKGHAHYERVDKVIAFEGKNSILDRSVVIHANADDFTSQPTGASGDKIACGVIKAVSKN